MQLLVALPVGTYLIGAIPFGWIVGRLRGVDVRQRGSGNIGATNVARSVGKLWALLVLVLDVAKGAGPAFLARRLAGQAEAHLGLALTMSAAVTGHVFPVFLKFAGGKGVATGLGVCAVAVPWAALVGAGIYAVLFALFRISSLGSLGGLAGVVGASWVMPNPLEVRLAATGIALLIVWRHRDNLRRLWRGTEGKL